MAELEAVPVVPWCAALAQGDAGDAGSSERLRFLHAAFVARFGHPPEVVGVAPGRVNLIGEHVDYSGYGVLPVAMTKDVAVAVRRQPSAWALAVANTDDRTYPEAEMPLPLLRCPPAASAGLKRPDCAGNPSLADALTAALDGAAMGWAKYVLCGFVAAVRLAHAASDEPPDVCGLEVMVDGRVPPAAGLSSSSALVCASAVATAAAHSWAFSPAEVAEECCRTERFVGTAGGGMDHAISMMAEAGACCFLTFVPALRAETVPLPEGVSIVVAHSLVESRKAVDASSRFNTRVLECRLAAMLLASSTAVRTLREAQDAVAPPPTTAESDQALVVALQAAGEAARRLLHEEPYTVAELEAVLGSELATVFQGEPQMLGALASVIASGGGLRLRQRALHVYGEALRVIRFRQVCLRGSRGGCDGVAGKEEVEGGGGGNTVAELRALMDDSHASCRDLYDCSCAELDAMVAACGGGARLCGAGWGGCIVALAEDTTAGRRILACLADEYYCGHLQMPAAAVPATAMFTCEPASGARAIVTKHFGSAVS